jgi:Cytochrome P450
MSEQHPVVSAIGAAFDPAAPGFQDAHVLYARARREEPDITREPGRHLAFGFGVHLCAGLHLAQREVEVALETLTTRLPSLRLVPGPTPR